MIPIDCVPETAESSVIEIIDGPNKHGEYTFFEYGYGQGHFQGVRGQIFLRRLDQFSESQKRARCIDHRH